MCCAAFGGSAPVLLPQNLFWLFGSVRIARRWINKSVHFLASNNQRAHFGWAGLLRSPFVPNQNVTYIQNVIRNLGTTLTSIFKNTTLNTKEYNMECNEKVYELVKNFSKYIKI
jgi:hypothetical protein